MTEPLRPRYDADTLHEIYDDLDAVHARISSLRVDVASAPDDTGELLARGDLVDLLRATGQLDEALAEARAAVDRSRMVGTPAQQHTAALREAQVLSRRGGADEAYEVLLADASRFGPVIEAVTHDAAGRNDYDRGRYATAAEHFAAALAIQERLELEDQVAASLQALDAARRKGEPA